MHIRQWREARRMTQQQLAEAVGRDKSVISKLERGLSGLTGPMLEAVAKALGVHPGALYEPPPEGTRPLVAEEGGQVGRVTLPGADDAASGSRGAAAGTGHARGAGYVPGPLVGEMADLPIYASAQGGSTGMLIDFESPIDWVKRPEPLFNVKKGFGMYVVGDSMEPAYRQGDMILVHPHKPANKGDDVLIVKTNGDGRQEALVKQLVSMDDRAVRVKQWNPAKSFTVPRGEVSGIYVIVGKYNRR